MTDDTPPEPAPEPPPQYTSAYLLLLPSSALAGFAVGYLLTRPIPWMLMGLGFGAFVCGLVLAVKP